MSIGNSKRECTSVPAALAAATARLGMADAIGVQPLFVRIAAVNVWAEISYPAADMNTRRKATRKLTAAAVLAALGVVFLALGAVVEVLDLSMAAIASLTVVFAVIELRGKYPVLVYLVTALLAFLLLPSKTPALFYACFAGYYPMLKAVFEGRFSSPVSWLLKLFCFFASMSLIVFAGVKLLFPSGFVWQPWYMLILLPLALVFVLYDVALTRLITFYVVRLQRKFRFLQNE